MSDKTEKQAERDHIQSIWNRMLKLPPTIECKWEGSQPVSGDDAECEVKIGDTVLEFSVAGEYYADQEKPLKRRAKEYQQVVEKWALWKWHTIRGTPVTERDAYITEPGFKAPEFVWQRGPGRPKADVR